MKSNSKSSVTGDLPSKKPTGQEGGSSASQPMNPPAALMKPVCRSVVSPAGDVSSNLLSQKPNGQEGVSSVSQSMKPSAAPTRSVGQTELSPAKGVSVPSSSNRERKRAWTEDEHKRVFLGLKKVGQGDWKGISRNFVKSRTSTQVASHAHKYFLRRTNLNRLRRRSSLFDITTETSLFEREVSFMQVFPEVAVLTRIKNAPQTVPVTFQADPPFNTAVPAPLSLNLSLSFNFNEQSNSRHSAFTMMPSFRDGDSNSSIIRVA